MSRIGKKPIPIPAGVTAQVDKGLVRIKGPKGELSQRVDPSFAVKVESQALVVDRPSDEKVHRAKHGLYRALLNNMVTGVTAGFARTLEIEGVGYNAKLEGKDKLLLSVGFNAPVVMMIPAGIKVECPKNTVIVVSGSDRQAVGQFAANVRRVRPPEPYKGKGIRYQGEAVRRKAGKAIGGKG